MIEFTYSYARNFFVQTTVVMWTAVSFDNETKEKKQKEEKNRKARVHVRVCFSIYVHVRFLNR